MNVSMRSSAALLLSVACSPIEEDVVLSIPQALLEGSKSVIIAMHTPGSLKVLSAAPTESLAEFLPEVDRSYSGGPLTLSILTYSKSLEFFRLRPGPLREAETSSRYSGSLDWSRPDSPFVAPLKVISISTEDGTVTGPLEHAFADLSPSVRDLEVEVGPGFCDPPRTNLIFEGDLPDIDDAPDYRAAVIRTDGVAILGGFQGRRDPETQELIGSAVLARLDLPALGSKPDRVEPTILDHHIPAPFWVVRQLLGGDRGLIGSVEARTGTTAQQYLFEADEDGNAGEPWPGPFTDPSSPFRMSMIDTHRVLLFTATQVFELDRTDRSVVERTEDFPRNLWDYAHDEDREYAATIVTSEPPNGRPPTFREPVFLTRPTGQSRWSVELSPDTDVPETDWLPVMSIAAGPSGPIATANATVYLREDSGEWIGETLGSETIGKVAGLSISAERRVVFGFAGLIGVHHPLYGWCRVPNSGSSRSANIGVADPGGRYAIGLDQGNRGATIPSWLAIMTFED